MRKPTLSIIVKKIGVLICICGLLLEGCSRNSPIKGGDTLSIYYSDSVLVVQGDSIICRITASDNGHIVSAIPDIDALSLNKTRRVLVGSIFSVIILISIGLIYTTIKRKLISRLNHELAEREIKLERMQSDIDALEKKSDTISNTFETILKDNITTIKQLSDERTLLNKKITTDYYPDKLEELQGKVASISLTMDRLYKRVPIQKNLEETMDSTKDQIISKARRLLGGSLNESDYQVLTGVFAGLGAKEISFITGIAQGTVRTKKSRIKSKLEDLPESAEKILFLSFFNKQ